MIQLLRDGLLVFQKVYPETLFFFLVTFGLGQGLRRRLLSEVDFPAVTRIPISLVFGTAGLSISTFVLAMINRLGSQSNLWLALLIALASLPGLMPDRTRERLTKREVTQNLLFLLAMFGLLILRLGFLRGVLFPSYADSAEHYAIVQDFLSPQKQEMAYYSITRIFSNYYHFGFHSLSAWLAMLFRLSAEQAILLMGQYLLVLISAGAFASTILILRKPLAGWLVFVVSIFGWQMPGFTLDWGKYPLLSGLAVIPILPGLLASGAGKRPKKELVAAISILMLAATLNHSRMAILVILGALVFMATRGNWLEKQRWIPLVISGGVLLLLGGVFVQQDDLMMIYFHNNRPLLILLTVSMPWVIWQKPRLSLRLFVFTLGMLLLTALRLPVTFGLHSTMLLDPTLVAISLSLPFAFLLGAGMAEMVSFIPQISWKSVVAIFFFGISLTGVDVETQFRPHPCCQYVQGNDLQAYEWIRENTLPGSVFIIPGIPMQDYVMDVDGGAWITPLTGQAVETKPFQFDLNLPENIHELCSYGNVHVYQDEMPLSFKMDSLHGQSNYFKVYSDGGISIYQLKNCAESSP